MKVKVGDNVKILTGKDKGKEGKVIKTLKKENRVVVEGLNMVKRNVKARSNEDKGGIVDIEASIHVSNVKVVEAKAKATKTEKKEVKAVEAKVSEVKKETKKTVTKKAPAKKTTSKKEAK